MTLKSSNPSGISRARFLKLIGGSTIFFLADQYVYPQSAPKPPGDLIFLSAPQFDDRGGWDVDQQSMDQMGSAYLLAHGLGVPVADAVTAVKVTSPGNPPVGSAV